MAIVALLAQLILSVLAAPATAAFGGDYLCTAAGSASAGDTGGSRDGDRATAEHCPYCRHVHFAVLAPPVAEPSAHIAFVVAPSPLEDVRPPPPTARPSTGRPRAPPAS